MQRVAIARALVNQPTLLLADEPTGNLDTRTRDEILSLLRDLNDDGLTILLTTHDTDLAKCATRVLHIRDGLLMEAQNEHSSPGSQTALADIPAGQ